jgi:hypothetical protein
LAEAATQRACAELQISLRTYQRWTQDDDVKADRRPKAQRPEPSNKLTEQEREEILTICNEKDYQSLIPSQIVPALADKIRRGVVVKSELLHFISIPILLFSHLRCQSGIVGMRSELAVIFGHVLRNMILGFIE